MARGCRRRDNANQRRDLSGQARDIVLDDSRGVVAHLQISSPFAGSPRTFCEEALFQRLEPGVGLVASGWRPVATSGEVSEVGAEGSTTTTEEPGVHLDRLGLRRGGDRVRGRHLPGRRLGPRHGRRGLWWHEGGTSPSFLIVQFAELSTRGAPLSRLRSIPGLRERAGIERLAQGERPHVLFTRGCYPGKTLLALPKGNTAKF